QVFLADENAIRHVGKAVRDGDADVRAFDFVVPLILARPPRARAGALADGIDERFAVRVFPERDAASATTPGLRGSSGIVEVDRDRLSLLLLFWKVDQH